MANKLSLGLVIGGVVSSSVGAAFNTVTSGIKKLEQQGNKAKVLKSTIGETIRLREEWKKAHDSGAASAAGLLRKLDGNLESLRKQGVEVGRLNREYQRLGRTAKSADLQIKGRQQIEQGKAGVRSSVGQAVVGVGALGVAGKISADYQAIIRDIAIKAGVANQPKEAAMSRTVIQTAQDTGMARNDVADLVNQLVGAGMELDKAMAYAPVAAKFAIGQGASGVDTASMIQALEQNAKITDPKVMQQALEAIALQGQAGSFEAADMAKWFPQLLAGMEKNGSTGLGAVSSLGAMLQVQMKTAGGSDEAANNLKNWMEKIGSGDVVKAYADAGIDYQSSLNSGIQKGMSTLESSFALAMKYVQATDPAKAAKMAEAQANISKEVDPEKAKAALESLEKSLRTGDIFADMQVKAALTAYAANRGLYENLKAQSTSKDAAGILDKNLAERRESSAQMWAETAQAANDAMRSMGDAIRPATDLVAKSIKAVAQGLTNLSDGSQAVVFGLTAAGAAFVALKTVLSGLKVARGMANIGRGVVLGRAGSKGLGDVAEAVAEKGPQTGIKPVDAGLKALGGLLGASNDDNAGSSKEPQRVFVVNANAIGSVGATGAAPAGSRRARRRQRRTAGRATPAPKLAAPAIAPGRFAKMLGAAGKLGMVGRVMPGGSMLDAGVKAVDTYMNAETKEEKAEGYGGAVGGLGGALAGAATGAALGAVIPIVGPLVGGAVGAFLGGMGGESLGGLLGKSWFGGEDKPDEVAAGESPLVEKAPATQQAKAVEVAPVPAAPALPGPVVPPVVVTMPAPVPMPVPAAAPVVAEQPPAVSYDPRDPNAKDPFLLPALASHKARFPGAELVPQEPVAAPVVATMPAPVPVQLSAAAPVVAEKPPAVSYDPRDPNAKDPFLLPALASHKARFPGAELVPQEPVAAPVVATMPAPVPVQVSAPAPVVAEQPPAVPYDPRDPNAKDPFLLPALASHKLRFPGAGLVRPEPAAAPIVAAMPAPVSSTPLSGPSRPAPAASVPAAPVVTKIVDQGKPQVPIIVPGAPAGKANELGDVVRSLVPAVPPAAALPVPTKVVEQRKPEAPKIDQQFSFAPKIEVTVNGDVKDPAQLANELAPHLQRQFEEYSRQALSRQLLDAPHA
ncbi:phage tail tape measure protein [Pseudomonas sp. JQ170]|uniref:phage tail tape measure protein n=1 Tax=unclassified Pseudomonas TaxID=196821 RepID=UPI002650DC22|nr:MULTISPECIES: phage tail tape measure protein [unclassified Pseudomonas]MDN7142684.1 phage tail tape measure protein [Pseudomonas sp. JQ170]WRO77964.1 phage tail tape measure protein [Pseudomonas sp. 170C]